MTGKTNNCAGVAWAALAALTIAGSAHAQTLPATPDTAKAADDEHPLTWHGITIYGTLDIGVGWVSHGLPENGDNYEGESLLSKNGGGSRFVFAQNNLSQTGVGIRGKEEFTPGWSVVFNASTGINPQSGDLANQVGTNVLNNGLPRAAYSFVGDGARAG
ncbi:porin, partial [Novosphingobium sp. FSW06-99]|uniref:porin n=1 Tax=Novosphingobium sp. FSW06-99 TaxID=1739113 RepID=UPI0018D27276